MLNFALGGKRQIFQTDENCSVIQTWAWPALSEKPSCCPYMTLWRFSHSVMFLIWMNMPVNDKSAICSSAHAVCWLRFWLSHCLLASCPFTQSHMNNQDLYCVEMCFSDWNDACWLHTSRWIGSERALGKQAWIDSPPVEIKVLWSVECFHLAASRHGQTWFRTYWPVHFSTL